MHSQNTDDFVCFLCDYGLFILAGLIVLIAFLVFGPGNPIAGLLPAPSVVGAQSPALPDLPQGQVTIVSSAVTNIPPRATVTVNTASTATMMARVENTPSTGRTSTQDSRLAQTRLAIPVTPTANASPEPAGPPEYVIAFIPVDWKGTHESFLAAAKRQGDFFVQSSGIDQYFQVRFTYFEKGYAESGLDDSELLDKMLNFALKNGSADRFVGLTDGDLAPGGRTWVAGYTYGTDTQGILAEIGEDTISAHELGHTYGLCDEYNYSTWNEQNQEAAQGCPNPYPPICPRDTGIINECNGADASGGKRSIMAVAGPPNESAYNEASLNHLQQVFINLSKGGGKK